MPTLWRCTTSSTQTSRSHWSSSTWWDQQNLCPHVLHDSSVVLCTDAKMKCILHYDYSWASAEPRRIIQEQLLQVVCLWCACSLSTLLTIPPPPLLSFSSRTKTSSSTWTTAGTSWACRMSRWATAGCLLARPTSSTVTALRLAVSTLEMLLVCPLVVESRQCGGRMKCMLSLENWVSCACLCACCRNVETENT